MNGTPRESPRDGVGFVGWVVASPGVTTTATYSARWRLSRVGQCTGVEIGQQFASIAVITPFEVSGAVRRREGRRWILWMRSWVQAGVIPGGPEGENATDPIWL